MNKDKSWLTEFYIALKTLSRNPFLKRRISKIGKPKIFLYIILGYFVFTSAHIAINWKTFSFASNEGIALVIDLALQTIYLQQQSLLFIFSTIAIPVLTVIDVIREKANKHMPFVRLTPLSKHQIVIGILSQHLVFALLGIVLHLPITIISLLMDNVEFSYVVVTTCSLLIETILFISIAFLIGLLCNENLLLGFLTILAILIFNFITTP